MPRQSVFDMSFIKVYQALTNKLESLGILMKGSRDDRLLRERHF